MKLELHRDAVLDAREARLWYAERSVDTSMLFFTEIKRAFSNIAETPMR